MRLVVALTVGLVAYVLAWAIKKNGFDAFVLLLTILTLAAVVEIALQSASRRD